MGKDRRMQYLERMDQVHKVYAEFCKSVQKNMNTTEIGKHLSQVHYMTNSIFLDGILLL